MADRARPAGVGHCDAGPGRFAAHPAAAAASAPVAQPPAARPLASGLLGRPSRRRRWPGGWRRDRRRLVGRRPGRQPGLPDAASGCCGRRRRPAQTCLTGASRSSHGGGMAEQAPPWSRSGTCPATARWPRPRTPRRDCSSALQAGLSAEQDPDGILGVSGQLLVLMQANYEVVYTGGWIGRQSTGPDRRGPPSQRRTRRQVLAGRCHQVAATAGDLRHRCARVISEDAYINPDGRSAGTGRHAGGKRAPLVWPG